MTREYKRLPKGFDRADRPTTYRLGDLLPKTLQNIEQRYSAQPDLMIAAWPSFIGPQIAPLTKAVSFVDGILTVRVSNSTLYSLLVHDRGRLLARLKQRFPRAALHHLCLKLG